jgi:RHS repeat-associated protein
VCYLKPNNCVDNQTVATATKGLATGSWTRVPTTTAEMKAETSYILYDAKYRPIRNYTTNYLGGFTCTDSKLDAFSGQLQYTVQKHKRTSGDAELTVKEAFTYSAQNRLLTHTHQINGGAEQLLADNTYDELGKLTSKKVGNTSALPLQKVDYTYNVRGWLTKINEIGNLQQGTDPADLFGFKINYNTVDGNVNAANKLYNGNIAETFWSTATDGGFVRNYGYNYDNLNRLKDATYQKSGQVTGMYNENLSYDKNGNIKNLSRYGDRDEQYLPIQIDNLGYTYATNSNKLLNVADTSNNTSGFNDFNKTGDDYVYDANGNMTVDKNKNITGIVYNHLNLPTKIIFPTGNIVYFYNASGQKVQKVVTETTTVTSTDYLGGYQYKNTVLQFFPTAEGYVKNTPVSGTNTYSYVFNYTDHLGNVRLSYAKDTTTGSLKILEENNYYPFGLKHNSYNVDNFQPEYKYQYNGKEMQDELGLNMYDYGNRNYDPAIGRFMNIDPLIELMKDNSTYSFAFNNPVYFEDYEGLIPIPQIVRSSRTSSGFGLRMHPVRKKLIGHGGVDLVAPVGSDVKSAAIGTVAKIGWDPDGYGNYIIVEHIGGYYTLYGHLSGIGSGIKVGSSVGNGQSIGSSGNTGGSTGPHLHFEIIKSNSLSGAYNKSNKVNPSSIYDLNTLLYPSASKSKGIEDIVIPHFSFNMDFLFPKSSTNNSDPRTPITPITPLTPQPIVPSPTPSPSPTPIIPTPTPTPTPTPMPFPHFPPMKL